tara:strand:- start:4619 stop:5074 length:456 start_codon:yes stop_codon:yes gene_type:complete
MNNRKWMDYVYNLNETQDDLYVQKLYKLPVRFKVQKLRGGNKSETEDDLRALPFVTSLSLPRDRKADSENWYFTLDVKFEFYDRELNISEFIRSKLLTSIREVPGVQIISYGEPEFVYDAQNPDIGKEKQRSREFGGDKRKISKRPAQEED